MGKSLILGIFYSTLVCCTLRGTGGKAYRC
jgi:hypothetical protein